jgi:hypothetical protein
VLLGARGCTSKCYTSAERESGQERRHCEERLR